MDDGRTLERILGGFGENEGNFISTQQDIENEFSFLLEDAIYQFLERLDVPLKKFSGIATFSAQYLLNPRVRTKSLRVAAQHATSKVLSG